MYDKEMKLSDNFKLKEFTNSHTAVECGINNDNVDPIIIENMKTLCEKVLEPIRREFKIPIIITSGYRCMTLNIKVGGVKNSQHIKGEAADFKVFKSLSGISIPDSETLRSIYKWMVDNLEFDQLIWEVRQSSKWIHVSYKRTGVNRQQVFTIKKLKK